MNRAVSHFRLVCLALCAACFAPLARAATRSVPAQYPTIQAAVTAANVNDTVLVADGTYTGAGNYNIDFGGKDLTVQSASGNPAACIINCQQAGCAFILKGGETVKSRIIGFTITKGTGYANFYNVGGGIYMANNAPIVNNCVFTNNSATHGGGIYNGTATNCVFSGNNAALGGGMSGGTATNCTFTGNTTSSNNGGGMGDGTATKGLAMK